MSNQEVCPVSGLPVTKKEDWFFKAADHPFQIDLQNIGDRIFLIRHTGFKQTEDVDRYFSLLKQALEESLPADQTFCLLMDYSHTVPSNLAIRRYYVKRGLETIHRTDSVVYFGLDRLSRVLVKMGNSLSPLYTARIYIQKDYESAIRFVLSQQNGNMKNNMEEMEDTDSKRRKDILHILSHMTMGGDLQQSIPELPESDDYAEVFEALRIAQGDLRYLIMQNQQQAQQLQIANQELEQNVRKRTIDLHESQERYRALFMDSPIALFEEDYSKVKAYIDRLKERGITDIRGYFTENPEELKKCRDMLNVVDANREAMRQNNLESSDGLVPVYTLKDLDVINMPRFLEEIVTLADGSLVYEGQAWHKTLSGKPICSILRTAIAPHCEDTWSKVFVSLIDVTRQVQVEEALAESQQRYRSLFEDSPVALLEEDFSKIKALFDQLRSEGVSDIRNYLHNHMDVVRDCSGLIKYGEVNQAALDIYQAVDKKEFVKAFEENVDGRFNAVHLARFADELSTLAEGQTRFRGEATQQTIAGAERYMAIRTIIAPGYEDTWSKILVSFTDVTEQKRLDNLRRVMAAMVEDLDLDQVLARILQYLEQVIYFDSATVFLHEKDGYRVAAQRGIPHERYQPGSLHTADASIQCVVEAKKSVIQPTISPVSKNGAGKGDNSRAWMGIPLLQGNEVVGLLVVENINKSAFGDQEAALTEDLAHQAAIAIKNATLYQDARRQAEDLQQRDRILQAVSKLAENLLKVSGWEDYISIELERLGSVTGADRVMLYEFVGTDTKFNIKLRHFWKEAQVEDHSAVLFNQVLSFKRLNLVRWVKEFTQGNIIQGKTEDFPEEEQLQLERTNIRFAVIVPIFVQSDLWGLLGFDECQGKIEWSEPEIDAMRAAAGIIGAAVERERTGDVLLASQKLADLGTLAAGVAHELNSPLQVITGYSEGLLRQIEHEQDIDTTRLENSLRMINRSGWRSAEIVRSLLAYTRSSGTEYEPVDINELVRDTLLLVEHQMRSWMNINITTELEQGMPAWRCDANQITQVLINLLTNARDAMPYGGNIHIQTYYEPEPKKFVLKVSDTGIGIPEEIRSKIFNPFFTTKPVGQGTGLGLSILLGIVKAHRGQVDVESTPGEGTTFILTFPEIITNFGPVTAVFQNKTGRFEE